MAGDVESNPGPATRQTQLPITGELESISSRNAIKDLTLVVSALKDEVASLRGEVREMNIKDEVLQLQSELKEVKSATEGFKQRIDSTDNILRQKNLIFYGLEERNDGQRETWEDGEKLVRNVLINELKLDGADDDSLVAIDRVHQIGKKTLNSNRPRPVKVCFHRLRTRDLILTKSRTLLKESTVHVSEDYSEQVRSIRKALIPHLQEAKKISENFVILKYDKLIINKDVFTFNLTNKQLVQINK
ncbi:hypothetical protein SNE40_002696 [Patella caerulea]